MDEKRFAAIKATAFARRAGGVVPMTIGELVELAKRSQNAVLLAAATGLDEPGYAGGEIYPPASEVAAACEALTELAPTAPAVARHQPAAVGGAAADGGGNGDQASDPLFQE